MYCGKTRAFNEICGREGDLELAAPGGSPGAASSPGRQSPGGQSPGGQSSGGQSSGSSGWTNGDFNWDGIISGDDYSAIDFNLVAQNITGDIAAHIHSGAPGQNGPPLVFLFQAPPPVAPLPAPPRSDSSDTA